MLRFFASKKKLNKTNIAVLELAPQVRMLAEEVQKDQWLLSYFLEGRFGNILFGLPEDWRAFDDLFKRLGGVAYIIPTHRWHSELALQDLFSRYGPQIIATTDVEFKFPITDWRSCIPSLKISSFEMNGSNFLWSGIFNDKHFQNHSQIDDEVTLDLRFPRYFHGELNEIAPWLADLTSDQRFHPVEVASRLDSQFQAERLVTYQIPGTSIIACYDDVFFERHDADFLGPQHRSQLSEALTKLGATSYRGNEWRLDGMPIKLTPTPKTLSSEPLDNLHIDSHSVWLMTATQAAFLLIQKLPAQSVELSESLRQLIAKLPVNLAKLEFKFRSQNKNQRGTVLEKQLTQIQANTRKHFQHFRVKGLKGRRAPESQLSTKRGGD